MRSVLKKLALQLNKHPIIWGVGGSYTLAHYNIFNIVNDIDLLIAEKDAAAVDQILSKIAEKQPTIQTEPFQTKHFFKYNFENISIDVMGGFQISHKNGLYHLAFDKSSITNHDYIDEVSVPLSSLEDWYILYSLIPGRQYKADLIESYWKIYHVQHPDKLKNALQESLPDDIRSNVKRILKNT